MTYPVTEPYESGRLPVGDGHHVYWELCGNPHGKPSVVLHGGPGQGQRPGGGSSSTPSGTASCSWTNAAAAAARRTPVTHPRTSPPTRPRTSLLTSSCFDSTSVSTAGNLFGGSWGSTLGLAYAVEHPDRVTEMVLWGVVTSRAYEIDWLTRQMGQVYPEAFDELVAVLPADERDGNIPAAYQRLLASPDPEVHGRAALAWCAWEDRLATLSGPVRPSPRYADPRFRLCFARLVTHYFGHHAFLPDDGIVGRLDRIAHLPAVLVRGRLDIAAPLRSAWELSRALPLAQLHVVEGDAHGDGDETNAILVAATDRFARESPS